MFPFEDVQLAMWRLQTYDQFGGTWLSDYVPNIKFAKNPDNFYKKN